MRHTLKQKGKKSEYKKTGSSLKQPIHVEDRTFGKKYPIAELYIKTQDELAELIYEKLTDCGYQVETDKEHYIVGIPPDGVDHANVILVAHLDLVSTVPPKLSEIYYMENVEVECEYGSNDWSYYKTASPKTYRGAIYGLLDAKKEEYEKEIDEIIYDHVKKKKIKTGRKIKKKYLSYPANTATCLGADDRNGVYAILSILDKGLKPYVIFCYDEEVGCVGSYQLATDLEMPKFKPIKEKLNKAGLMIQIDRGSKNAFNEIVYYEESNLEFQDWIEDFGFKPAEGSTTDVRVLSEVLKMASCNIAGGYVNEHGRDELCLYDALQETISKLEAIITKSMKDDLYFKKGRTPILPVSNIWGGLNSSNIHNDAYDEWEDRYGYDYYKIPENKKEESALDKWWDIIPRAAKQDIFLNNVADCSDLFNCGHPLYEYESVWAHAILEIEKARAAALAEKKTIA